MADSGTTGKKNGEQEVNWKEGECERHGAESKVQEEL